ncbi:unnamed protein product [Symbiodinium natans]|uniref:Uncharacterized protein n=1 Tax=Symbiodinium natans TaxID=878477 RepID=A0A812IFR3_9DINO|nr:unnamed protein product [Symbiodinium natans]
MVRIDYSDTRAFTQRIEKEKAAKALCARKSGETVGLTDQPERWVRQTMRPLPAEAEAPEEPEEGSAMPPSTPMGPEGLMEAWLALSPEQREESGLRLATISGPRPPERCGPRRRSGALLLTGSSALAREGQAPVNPRPAQNGAPSEDPCERWGLKVSSLALQRPRSQSSHRRRQAPVDRSSSVSSLRPEFFCSWLRRSDGFVRVTRGQWAP